ncbi:hypothetical protein D1646_06450 [Pseudoflavonifractor sp. 60]|uniref:hypothetical protein n=1 Tax=Pseudoflavonifractor sp. 60 TaxID=2304576 RepID=UPI00136EDF82|nr:hypothetical protein [Pseudoflavonifractor sp. 60]NBI66459.1 hypothetical protein [Pseudoflavonifractor sp. 60]
MVNITDLTQEELESLELTQQELEELERARAMPITFDEDCPEITPEQARRFRRVNPVKRTIN